MLGAFIIKVKIHSCQASNDLRFMDGMHHGMVSDSSVIVMNGFPWHKVKRPEGWDESLEREGRREDEAVGSKGFRSRG